MLYRETVSSELLELLERLMKVEDLQSLRLVGGTALALQLGHRNSVDIDLFGRHEMDEQHLNRVLSAYATVEQLRGSKSIKVFLINGVKVDFVNYSYPWLDPVLEIENIRMASVRDIAAMKIAAITQRGSKKDFIDLYFLLQQFSLTEILAFYKQKITDGNEWMALRSIPYFDDADRQPMPAMFNTISWEAIKASITKAIEAHGGFEGA